MDKKRVRMSDVAKAAGVSRTTASFVLSGKDCAIPEVTRLKVRKIAEQMQYRPNATARSLVTGKTYRLSVVLNLPENFHNSFSMMDRYFTEVISGVQTGAWKKGYNLLLHTIEHPDWQHLRDDILSGASDGCILIARFADDPLTTSLVEANFPTVCVSYRIDHPGCCFVDAENRQGGDRAMEYLLSLGHRRIAFLYPGDHSSWGWERKEGVLDALRRASLPESALVSYSWQENRNPESCWLMEVREKLLKDPNRPTAIICCDESRACWFTEHLPEAGLRVPEDISVLGFNSTIISQRTTPPTTSVAQSLTEIGNAAVHVLDEILEGKLSAGMEHRFPMQLHIRQSTAPPSAEYEKKGSMERV